MKKDVKKLQNSGKDVEKLLKAVEMLSEGEKLPPEYRDHPLAGNFKGKRDCHIEPDWILIYAIENDELILYRTGSHSELFE
jgi:mRNA interferase YafQ